MVRRQAIFWGAAALLVAAAAGYGLLKFLSVPSLFDNHPATRHSLTLCAGRQPTAALIFLAQEKGFFGAEGLDLTLKEFVSGRRALEEMLKTGAEMASAAEVPVVLHSFGEDRFRIIAAICEGFNIPKIVARADHGISKPEDLKGKRIAVQSLSSLHFFLHVFLTQYGLDCDAVGLVAMDLEKIPGALAAGNVDAAVIREPWINPVRERLGKDFLAFEETGLYMMLEVLVAKNEFLAKDPDAVKRVLRALLRAETFLREHPAEAGGILSRRLKIESEVMRVLAPLNGEVFLDQSIFFYLEEVARWLIKEKAVPDGPIPNFLKKMDASVLESVKKNRVRIL